jgi:hypothetical protein
MHLHAYVTKMYYLVINYSLSTISSSSTNTLDNILREIIRLDIPQPVRKKVMSVLQPKYDGCNLHETVKERLAQELVISETITNVIIPTFDIKRFRPIIFSTLKVILLDFLIISYFNIFIQRLSHIIFNE